MQLVQALVYCNSILFTSKSFFFCHFSFLKKYHNKIVITHTVSLCPFRKKFSMLYTHF
uniref:Uncharacterized protein n=1 Tax=Rhizophora mucronata TaxID=61149 RepID=A0A2P2Q7P3_RHIMU